MEEINSLNLKLCLVESMGHRRRQEKGVGGCWGRLCQRNGSDLENRDSKSPGVLVVYRTLMKMRFQRGIKDTEGKGTDRVEPGVN